MTGIERIAAERQRQIDVEKWTPEHDDAHDGGEIARAASCYAFPVFTINRQYREPENCPWGEGWWKPLYSYLTWGTVDDVINEGNTNKIDARIRDLVKGGALIAAEIDRLQRAKDK
jgi:hypothetical protein